MIKEIRSLAKSLASKLLMLLLIITFAVWGVGDMVRQNTGNINVATVGSEKITYNEYKRALYTETEKLKQILGNKLSADTLKNSGLEMLVLQQLVDNKLLLLESKNLGLRISDEDLAVSIKKNPTFQDDKGKFSKDRFEAMLRATGQNEKAYLDKLRGEKATGILIDSLGAVNYAPENAAKFLLSARAEERVVDVYTLPQSLIQPAKKPDDAQIKEYYEANGDRFTAPEYRTLSYVQLSEPDAKKSTENIKISEADIEEAYKQRIEEFKKPQRREVEQMLFADEETAIMAQAKFKDGVAFAETAKSFDILNKNALSLGEVTKDQIVAEAADAVFSQQIDNISEPIKSPFGWHLFFVKEIIPAETLPLEEVRPILEKDLKAQSAENSRDNLSNKLEDIIAGGSTLTEAAKELGLKITTLPPVDKNGKLANAEEEKSLPKEPKFLETAFKTEEKTESQLITGKDGVDYIVRVESIAPAHLRPLEEVKSAVIAELQASIKQKELAALAKKIAEDFTGGTKRAEAIKTYNLSPASLTVSQAKSAEQKLPPKMISDLFARKIGEASEAFSKNDGSYAIAVVKEIKTPKQDEKDEKYLSALENVRREYNNSSRSAIIEQYLRFLAGKYPLSVNSEALKMKIVEE